MSLAHPGNILVIMGSLSMTIEGVSTPEELRSWVGKAYKAWLTHEPSLSIIHQHLRARMLQMLTSDTLLALSPVRPSCFKGTVSIKRIIPIGLVYSNQIASLIPPPEFLPEPYAEPFVNGIWRGALVITYWPLASRPTFLKQGFH